jgi:hypothetical protein
LADIVSKKAKLSKAYEKTSPKKGYVPYNQNIVEVETNPHRFK